jgi:hypothetical protein
MAIRHLLARRLTPRTASSRLVEMMMSRNFEEYKPAGREGWRARLDEAAGLPAVVVR